MTVGSGESYVRDVDGRAPRDVVEVLRAGRHAMSRRCEAVAAVMASEAGVARVVHHERGLRGRAFPAKRMIVVPRPSTRRRLYVFAHECGHVALGHGRKPRHRQEFEAERYAQEAMRRHGVEIPEKELLIGRRYVARKIVQALRRGAKRIDREATVFCWEELPDAVRLEITALGQ